MDTKAATVNTVRLLKILSFFFPQRHLFVGINSCNINNGGCNFDPCVYEGPGRRSCTPLTAAVAGGAAGMIIIIIICCCLVCCIHRRDQKKFERSDPLFPDEELVPIKPTRSSFSSKSSVKSKRDSKNSIKNQSSIKSSNSRGSMALPDDQGGVTSVSMNRMSSFKITEYQPKQDFNEEPIYDETSFMTFDAPNDNDDDDKYNTGAEEEDNYLAVSAALESDIPDEMIQTLTRKASVLYGDVYGEGSGKKDEDTYDQPEDRGDIVPTSPPKASSGFDYGANYEVIPEENELNKDNPLFDDEDSRNNSSAGMLMDTAALFKNKSSTLQSRMSLPPAEESNYANDNEDDEDGVGSRLNSNASALFSGMPVHESIYDNEDDDDAPPVPTKAPPALPVYQQGLYANDDEDDDAPPVPSKPYSAQSHPGYDLPRAPEPGLPYFVNESDLPLGRGEVTELIYGDDEGPAQPGYDLPRAPEPGLPYVVNDAQLPPGRGEVTEIIYGENDDTIDPQLLIDNTPGAYEDMQTGTMSRLPVARGEVTELLYGENDGPASQFQIPEQQPMYANEDDEDDAPAPPPRPVKASTQSYDDDFSTSIQDASYGGDQSAGYSGYGDYGDDDTTAPFLASVADNHARREVEEDNFDLTVDVGGNGDAYGGEECE